MRREKRESSGTSGDSFSALTSGEKLESRGRPHWAGDDFGTWEEIFNSQSPQYGGWDGAGNYGAQKPVQNDTKIYIDLPQWSVLMFRKV